MSLARMAVRIDPPARRSALNFDSLADVADQHAVQAALVRRQQLFEAAEHADAEVVEDAAVRVRLPAELAAACADIRAGQLQRREEAGERRRGGDGHRHGGQADVDAVDAKRAVPVAAASSTARRG